MKTCAQCGFNHSELDQRCVRCGAALDAMDEPDPLAAADREIFDFAPGQGPRNHWWEAPLRWLGAPVRWFAIVRLRLLTSPLPEDVIHRRPWVAGALCVVPGLGQLYNHQAKKAVILFIGISLVFTLAAATFYSPVSNIILIGYLLAVVYAFNDGVVTAKRINREWLPWQWGVAYYCAWIFYISVLCLTFQFLARHYVIKFRHISNDVVAPYLIKGERIGIDCFTYSFLRDPQVGDVVYYDPPQLEFQNTTQIDEALRNIERNADTIDSHLMLRVMGGAAPANSTMLINPTSSVERIVAGPGQTFERRAGVFYRDGQPVAPDEIPLITSQLKADFTLQAPADGYIILMSTTGGSYRHILGQQPNGKILIPRLDDPKWITQNWPSICVVRREAIIGRVWLIYQPPPSRRWF